MLKKLFTLSIIIFALFANESFSQKKGEKSEKEKPIEIKANVMVWDSEKNLISGIKASDLKVFEDGVEQKITYFAEKKPILNLGFVIDNSGSMRYSLNELIWASSIIGDNLRETDEAFFVRFISSDKIEISEDWTSNKKSLLESFSYMYIEGGQSAVLDAVYLSAQKLLERAKKDKSKRYALLLISDVEERGSYYKFDETVKLFKDTDSQLFILSYANVAPKKKKSAKSLSHLLSLETGGTVYMLSKNHKKEELVTVLNKIHNELRSNYVIGYTPTNQRKDGKERKVTIQVTDDADGNKRDTFIRQEYTVPKLKN